MYALVAVVLALSTLAPFVRFGEPGPSLSAGDLAAVLLSLIAWTPFVAALLRLLARQGGWASHIFLFVAAPVAHTLIVLTGLALLSGQPVGDSIRTLGLGAGVLTLLGVLQYGMVLATLFALRATRAADQSRLEAARLRGEALRARLHPHFLFNTLNSISTLAPVDPGGAQAMIRKLSDLLRAVLADDGVSLIPLRRELELVEAYVAIQRVRFADRLRSRINTAPGLLEYLVPTFILQPLVENAIRHAIAARDAGGSVVVDTRLSGSQLVLEVSDDGPGDRAEPEPGGGLGLRTAQEQLAQLYGGLGQLVAGPSPDGSWTVRVTIPARTAS